MDAQNEQKIVLIITTKYYPINWPSSDVRLDELNIADNWNTLKWADFAYNDMLTAEKGFKKNPYIKTGNFIINRLEIKLLYQVFVVPCLDPCVVTTADQKGKYLQFVIENCSKNVCFGNIFLIAHDKDFNVEKGEDGYVTANSIKNMNSVSLQALVDIKHVYMFQHEVKRDVGGIVSKLPSDAFNDDMCDQLFNLVFAIKDMNEFFTSVDEDVFSRFCF